MIKIQNKILRPKAEVNGHCYILEIPALQEYTEEQQKVIVDLYNECLNNPVADGLVVRFVLNTLPRRYDPGVMWDNITEAFGQILVVEKLCQ